jgi:hypothetical protein
VHGSMLPRMHATIGGTLYIHSTTHSTTPTYMVGRPLPRLCTMGYGDVQCTWYLTSVSLVSRYSYYRSCCQAQSVMPWITTSCRSPGSLYTVVGTRYHTYTGTTGGA